MDIDKIKQEWSDDEFTIEYNDISSNISLEVPKEELKLTPITIKDLKDKLQNNSLQYTNVLDEKAVQCSKSKDILLATKPSDTEIKSLIGLTSIAIKDLKNKLQNNLQYTNVLDEKDNKCSKPKVIQTISLATKPSDTKNKSLIGLTPIAIKDLKDKLQNNVQYRNVLDEKGIKCSKPKDIQTISLATKPSDTQNSKVLKNSGLVSSPRSSPKVKPRNANKNVLQNKHANSSKLRVSFSSRISQNKILKPSFARPNNTTSFPFDGAKFLHTQVHSNPFLQSLLKDIVSLNNKKDDEDEDTINREIAKLRSKNKLPSLNAEIPIKVEFDDSDYLVVEDSEDDSFSYCNSKSSENYGKDSGYDNESQNSESLEEDNRIEIHENDSDKAVVVEEPEPEYVDNRSEIHENDSDNAIVVVEPEQEYVDNRSEIHENDSDNAVVVVEPEPEYVDLDHYFESNTNSNDSDKHKKANSNINPVLKKVEGAASNETISKVNQNSGFGCSHCYRTFKTKKAYALHAKNHQTCFNAALSKISFKDSLGTSTMTNNTLREKMQKKREHLSSQKNTANSKSTVLLPCKKCSVKLTSKVDLEQHYKNNHVKHKQYPNRNTFRKRARESSESDSVEIIEIDSD